MRALLIVIFALPGAAHAHIGHLGDLAGHDHWVAGAALGAAAAVTLWGLLKGKAQDDEAEAEQADDEEADAPEAEEQPA